MTRSSNDRTDFFKLCKAFKVDTSKVENNNLLTAPYEVVDEGYLEDIIGETRVLLASLRDNELKSYKSLKKDGLVERLDLSLEKVVGGLEYIESNMFKTVQRNKQTGEIVEVKDE